MGGSLCAGEPLAIATNLLVVRPSLPSNQSRRLVGYARANPGKLTLATSTTRASTISSRAVQLKAGISWTEVHYPRPNALAIQRSARRPCRWWLSAAGERRRICQSASCARWRAGQGPRSHAADVPTRRRRLSDVEGVTFNGIFAPRSTPGDRRPAERGRAHRAGKEGRLDQLPRSARRPVEQRRRSSPASSRTRPKKWATWCAR